MDDIKIIDLYWARDESAIAESTRKYGGYCHSIALRILENLEHSEECVNDTWLRAWNSMPPQRPAVLRMFLGAITRNLCLNRARDLAREKRGGGTAVIALDELQDCVPDTTSENAHEDGEITAAINQWLHGLALDKRVAFMRRYWFCDHVADVAKRMGWSESKTNAVLRRLRLSLREHLEREGIAV